MSVISPWISEHDICTVEPIQHTKNTKILSEPAGIGQSNSKASTFKVLLT